MLKNIINFRDNRGDGRIGYAFVPDIAQEPLSSAQAGDIVQVPSPGPPWIVVNDLPTTAILAKWPGKLWKVSIIEAASAKDQPLSHARYTRTLKIKVICEVDCSVLFGDHGHEIIKILQKASNMTREEAEIIANSRHPNAPFAYDRTFRRWANSVGIKIDYDDNLDGTLKISSKPHGSPIYEGLSVIHTVVFERAKFVDSKFATSIIDGEINLNAPWPGANAVLSDAALALGAPEFVSDEDRDILLSGWKHA